MDAKYLSLDEGCKREVVEGIIEVIPNVMVAIFFSYLVIEAVYIGDIPGLVVASKQHNHIWIFDLVKEEKENGFDRIVPSVHIISQKHIALFGKGSSLAEKLQQVPELAMNVPANGYWSLYWLHVRLLE